MSGSHSPDCLVVLFPKGRLDSNPAPRQPEGRDRDFVLVGCWNDDQWPVDACTKQLKYVRRAEFLPERFFAWR